MKAITLKPNQKSCGCGQTQRVEAQCCAKGSKVTVGCHD